MAPSAQYGPTKLINLGANRWAFKPELGLSRRWAYVPFGGDYRIVSAAWQYSWVERPK